MKLKHLMMVGLMLAVLTIGAASAADVADELELADDDADAVSQTDEVDIIAAEDDGDDEIAQEDSSIISSDDESIEDFEANFTEKINLDDENYNETPIVSIHVPNNESFESITIYVNENYFNGWDLSSYRGSNINWTYDEFIGNNWETLRIGNNDIRIECWVGYECIQLASGTIFVNKTLNKDDFNIDLGDEVYSGNYIFYSTPPFDGNYTVYVDGKKYLVKKVGGYDDFYFNPSDLNLTKDGVYNIKVVFEQSNGNLIDLADFNCTYYFNDEYMKIYCTADVEGFYEFINIEDYCPTNATLVIRINDEIVLNETYNQEFDLVRDFSFSDFNITVSPFTYCKVNVTYSKGDGVYSTERMLYTYEYPNEYKPVAMALGEKDAVIIKTQKGINGVLKVYTAKLVDLGYDFDYEFELIGTADFVDGIARVSLESLPEGRHEIVYEYNLEKYKSGQCWGYVRVINNTEGFESTISATTITEGEDVTIHLTGVNASYKRANLYVDGVKYSEMAFNLGEVMATVEGLSVGQHYITIKHRVYAQEVYHSNTFIVTVKQKETPKPQPKPPVPDKVTLKLNKVKVKRSAKKLVLTATLKINNKAKKGLKVIFKFKGKKYTAQTNKNGVAKVKIPKKVLKKLKAGKKVTYQASYGKTVKKISGKVKK